MRTRLGGTLNVLSEAAGICIHEAHRCGLRCCRQRCHQAQRIHAHTSAVCRLQRNTQIVRRTRANEGDQHARGTRLPAQ